MKLLERNLQIAFQLFIACFRFAFCDKTDDEPDLGIACDEEISKDGDGDQLLI